MYLIKRSTRYVFIKKFALTHRIRTRSIASYAEKSQSFFEFPQAGWLEVIYNYNASKLRIA